MGSRRVLVPLVLLLLTFSAAANAATVSYSACVPLQTTDWYSSLDFPKLAPSLGTLTSVAIEVRDSLVHEIKYENQSPTSGSRFKDSTYVFVDVLRPDNTSFVSAVSQIYKTAT
ncbi:MAG TPA: choice-of-anchor E domain-containing protein, partial [Terriglobales bacterium]|nr:choice-of-anchor E domain-containing protein [Terriglobales bacterium]